MVSLQGAKQIGLVSLAGPQKKSEEEGARLCRHWAMLAAARDADGAQPRPSPPCARHLQDTAAAGPKPGWAGATQPKPNLLSREKLQGNDISSFRKESVLDRRS